MTLQLSAALDIAGSCQLDFNIVEITSLLQSNKPSEKGILRDKISNDPMLKKMSYKAYDLYYNSFLPPLRITYS